MSFADLDGDLFLDMQQFVDLSIVKAIYDESFDTHEALEDHSLPHELILLLVIGKSLTKRKLYSIYQLN